MDEQQLPQTRMQKLKAYLMECRRVLRVTKKPTKDELKTVVKISGLGILVIGAIGFLIQMVKIMIFG